MQVRLKTLDGRWEEVGTDRLTNIFPEGIQATSNIHGSDTCRFTLKRDPGAIHPDLSAFTPCEILHDGRIVWSGRVWETPTKEGSDAGISVEGRGWQYHLDDQPFATPYVKINSEAKDLRSLPFAPISSLTAAGQVSNDGGSVTIGWPKGTVIGAYQGVGVYYDLGPEYEKIWPDFYVDLRSNATDGGITVYVRVYNGPDPVSFPTEYSDLYFRTVAVINLDGGFDLVPMTATTPKRYVSIFMFYTAGGGTFSNEETVQIRAFRIFAKPQYRQMMSESNLIATDIAQDAITKAAPLLKPSAERTPPFRDEILGNPKLTAYYRFTQLETISGVTSVRDQGPYGNHLTIGGAPAIVSGTYLDNSLGTEDNSADGILNFAGNDYSSSPITFASGHQSVAGVFSLNTASQYGSLFHIGNSGANGWGLYIGGATGGGGSTGSRLWFLRGGIAWHDTGIVLSAGVPYFFTAYWQREYAGKQLVVHLWTDAGFSAFDYYSGPVTPGDPPSATFTVGGNSAADGIEANIDEIALFDAPFDEYIGDDNYQARLAKTVFAKDDGPVHRTSFWIPEFPMDSAQTPREVLEAVNSLHDYIWKINHTPSLEFYERPTMAQFEVGRWSGAEFEDSSANAGEEIYNQVRVEGTGVYGEPVIVERGGFQTSQNIMPSNGTFEGGTANWSVFDPTKSAIATFTGAPATTSPSPGTKVLRVEVTAGPHSPTVITNSFIGSFQPGRLYRAKAWMYRTAYASDTGDFYVTNTVGGTTETISKTIPYGGLFVGAGSGFWFPIYVEFSFDVIGTIALNIMQQAGSNNYIFYLDGVEIQELPESLPTRYGFIRSKTLTVNAAMTVPVAERIGDVWIDGRTSTPFKGSLTHTSPEGIRMLRTGADVHPALMLNQTGEKLLFSHWTDPDTGDHGRLGVINTVSYDDSTGVSTITIDNTRLSFEALLARYTGLVAAKR